LGKNANAASHIQCGVAAPPTPKHAREHQIIFETLLTARSVIPDVAMFKIQPFELESLVFGPKSFVQKLKDAIHQGARRQPAASDIRDKRKS
jgi:hypothetical protein